MLPTKVTILVDNREKRPLSFPATIPLYTGRSHTTRELIHILRRSAKLIVGDYHLEGYDGAIIERKSGPKELYQNLRTNDRARFLRAFKGLALSCKHPYLLLDCPLNDFRRWELPKAAKYEPNGLLILDELLRLCIEYGVTILSCHSGSSSLARIRTGEHILRTLLNHYLIHLRDSL